jgi:hypothetical protein
MERSLIPTTLKIGRHWLPVDQIKRYEDMGEGVILVFLHGVDHDGEPDYLQFAGKEAAALIAILESSAIDVVEVARSAVRLRAKIAE